VIDPSALGEGLSPSPSTLAFKAIPAETIFSPESQADGKAGGFRLTAAAPAASFQCDRVDCI
jgi:hypothetical protein